MEVQEHKRVVGSTLTPLTVALVDDEGVTVNLSGYSVTFYMYTKNGVVKITSGSCTILSAPDGLVTYAFQAADVNDDGIFWGYFRVFVTGTPDAYDVYPSDRYLRIEITEGT